MTTKLTFAVVILALGAVATVVGSAERHFGGLDKFDSGTRRPSFTTLGGGR
jgi:hypothetical protein